MYLIVLINIFRFTIFIVKSHMDYLLPTIKSESHLELIQSLVSAIKIVAQKYHTKFRPGQVYDTKNAENITYADLRKSKTSKINYYDDQSIFKQVEQFVGFVNESYHTAFQMIPDDIDIIMYTEGDYFGKHTDFVPIKTPYMTYYSLILCLDADCQGGQTKLYFPDKTHKIFIETITPNSWLIFKNSIEHESTMVKTGYKIVLKANLVHLTLSPNRGYNDSLVKLVDSRNLTISKFKSKPLNVLSANTLSEYLFYRDCFKSDLDVIPFQFITGCGDVGDHISTTDYNGNPIKKTELSLVVWFNIGTNIPIISWTGVAPADSYDEIINSHPDYKSNKSRYDTLCIQKNQIHDLIYFMKTDEVNRIKLRNNWKGEDNLEVPGLITGGKFIEDAISEMSNDDIYNELVNYHLDLENQVAELKDQEEVIKQQILSEENSKLPTNESLKIMNADVTMNEIERTITNVMFVF